MLNGFCPLWGPLAIVAFSLVILLPGALLATVATRHKEVHLAEFLALTLGLGLVAAPLGAYLIILATGNTLVWPFLIIPALLVSIAAGVAAKKGHRPTRILHDRWLWAALGLVVLITFLTYDPSLYLSTLFTWVRSAAGNCFRQGTFQYLGIPSPTLTSQMPPAGTSWDGVMRGNVALSSLFTLLCGMSGLRWLRIANALLLAVVGFSLGRHLTGRRAGGFVGLVVFALNPFTVMIQEADRNVLALAWGALAFLALERRLLPPWAIGLLAGWTTGLGLQLLPALYIIPIAFHYLTGKKRDWRAAAVAAGTGLAVATIWLVTIGWYDATHYQTVYTYDMGLFVLRTHYSLGFPFSWPIFTQAGTIYPAFLAFPLHVIDTFGVLLLGIALAGVWRLRVLHRRTLVTVLLFGLPSYLVVALMTGMVEDQLRLIVVALLPILVCLTVGLDWLAIRRNQIHRLVFVSLLSVVLFVAASGMGRVKFPRSSLEQVVRDQAIVNEGRRAAELFNGAVTPYLSQETVERRKRIEEALLAREAPDISDGRLKRSLPVANWLPNYLEPHPIARIENVMNGRWLDYEMSNPLDFLVKESWEGRVNAEELKVW